MRTTGIAMLPPVLKRDETNCLMAEFILMTKAYRLLIMQKLFPIIQLVRGRDYDVNRWPDWHFLALKSIGS